MRALILATILTIASSAHAIDPVKLFASDAAASDNFGWEVAIDGDTAVVGAYRKNGFEGAAYVFRWDGTGWVEEQKLLSSDLVPLDRFGHRVAIDGDTIIVGAYSKDSGAGVSQGAAYVFTRSGTTWTEQQKLLASDGAGDEFFGYAVAIDGDTAVIGASRAEEPTDDEGAVYIYTRSGTLWTEQAKILSPDPYTNGNFGQDVGIDNDSIVVGQRIFDNAGDLRGAAYVYTRSAGVWSLEQRLLAASIANQDNYARDVAIAGDTVAVGAYTADESAGADQGVIYTFDRSAGVWAEGQTLVADDAVAGDRMGYGLDMQGDTIITNTQFADTYAGVNSASTYIFSRDAGVWSQQAMFPLPDAQAEFYGTPAVGIWGDWAIIGFFPDDETDSDAGAAWLIERVGDTWRTSITENYESPTPVVSGNFGFGVDIDGDTAVVGSFGATGGGAAYVYARHPGTNTWLFQQELQSSDLAAADYFGYSVAIDGDSIVVGAYGESSNTGAAYVFTRSGSAWTEQQKLTASDGVSDDRFGTSVDIEEDTVVVGSYLDDNSQGINAGSVYVFTRTGSTWTEQARLAGPFVYENGRLGWSVSIDGDTIAAGATFGLSIDRVAIYTGSGASWSHQQTILDPEGIQNTSYGRSVALDADRLVVGTGAQRAHLYSRTDGTWTLDETFTSPDGSSITFGINVDIFGDSILFGATGYDSPTLQDIGTAFLYRLIGGVWSPIQRLESTMPNDFEYFGINVALDGDAAIVGSHRDDQSVNDAGSATFLNIAHEDIDPRIENYRTGAIHTNFGDAFSGALANDILLATPYSFSADPSLDPGATPLFIESLASIRLPHTGTMNVSSGSMFRSTNSATTTLFAPATIRSGGFLQSDGPLYLGRHLSLLGGDVIAPSITVIDTLTGAGTISSDTTNDGSVTIQSNTDHFGNYTNNATTTIQNGTLTILGTLTDNGTIVGDFSGGTRSASGGIFIEGPYSAASNASLSLLSSIMKLGSNADIAINDNTAFDLATSELRMVSTTTQSLEAMSIDISNNTDGLDRTMAGHYPLATLRIGPTQTTVNIVDAHDNTNDTQSTPEAIYTDSLIIDAGATLNTNGHIVYYNSLSLHGTVDTPANLVQLAQCNADLSGNGTIDGADLGLLLANWGNPGPADLNNDGTTDGADLGLLLAAWGPCP